MGATVCQLMGGGVVWGPCVDPRSELSEGVVDRVSFSPVPFRLQLQRVLKRQTKKSGVMVEGPSYENVLLKRTQEQPVLSFHLLLPYEKSGGVVAGLFDVVLPPEQSSRPAGLSRLLNPKSAGEVDLFSDVGEICRGPGGE